MDPFYRFLVDGTGNLLTTLETMFDIEVDQSASNIEITPAAESRFLKNIGEGTLYVVSAAISGDFSGRILLLLRKVDFEYLSEVLAPLLSLLFLSSEETDLETLEAHKSEWISNKATLADGRNYEDRMMDTLAELGNVIIGQYSKAMFQACKLNSHHSLPHAIMDPKQRLMQRVISSGDGDDHVLTIENEFKVGNRRICLWCLISPSKESFRKLLEAA